LKNTEHTGIYGKIDGVG